MLCTTLLLTLTQLAATPPDDWAQFRGPGATGVSSGEGLPVRWSATENVAWQREIPGMGWSCPIVKDDLVFVTTVVGTEVAPPRKGLYPGRSGTATQELDWVLMALDRESGETVWEETLHSGTAGFSVHQKNTYASETPVTDGERVYALFGGVGLYACTVGGDPVWSHDLDLMPMRLGWGTAASPALHDGILYVIHDNESQSWLAAYDAESGELEWKIDRDEKSNWSTPFVWSHEGRTEIVTPGSGRVRSYDLEGKLLWWLEGMSSITIATPYVHDGLLYVSSGYVLDRRQPVYAIRPGGSGDISVREGTSSEFVVWAQPRAAPYNPTTITVDGLLYVLEDTGTMACYEADSGKQVYSRERVSAGSGFTASPWSYGGNVFCLDEDGLTTVVKAGREFEILHTNELGEMCMATPAIAGDQLLIRTLTQIYCLEKDSSAEGGSEKGGG